jgi:type IV pilus assembly protein PilV
MLNTNPLSIKKSSAKPQLGLSLVEVMVTLLIIGVGLLGLLGMQAKSLSTHRDSFDRKTAAELMSQIGERMRANHLGFMADAYSSSMASGGTPTVAPTVSGAATAAEIAQRDLADWQSTVQNRLPSGAAYIVTSSGTGASMAVDGTSVKVTLAWREPIDSIADAACTAVGISDPKFRCMAAEVFP